MIRFFDVVFSFVGLIFLFPLFIVLAIWIKIDSTGPVFYKQERIGKMGRKFKLFKFRSMKMNADKLGLLTIGGRDPRITDSGYLLRKYKLDELPQLINVLKGEMSLVGPRPEVEKYTSLYTTEQEQVLQVRPGITDMASIAFKDENEILNKSSDPEGLYVSEIMPKKIELNMDFIKNPSVVNYFSIILKTIAAICINPNK